MESAICDFKHERSLRREWGISESSWKPQETSTQYHSTSSHSNYVEENAVLLSGRKPGFKDDHINLLFLSDTKISVWRKFKKACNESDKQSVCFSKFTKPWKQFHPNVIVGKPKFLNKVYA